MKGQNLQILTHFTLLLLLSCAAVPHSTTEIRKISAVARRPSSLFNSYRFKSTVYSPHEKGPLTVFKEGETLGLFWKKTGTKLEIQLGQDPHRLWWQSSSRHPREMWEEGQNDYAKYSEQAITWIDSWVRNMASLKLNEDDGSLSEIELSLQLIKDYLTDGNTETSSPSFETLKGSKFPHPFETSFIFQGNSPFNHQNENYQLTLKTESTCEIELKNKTTGRLYKANICDPTIRLQATSSMNSSINNYRKYSPWDDLNFDIESKLIQKISFHMEWQDSNTASPLVHSLRLLSQYLIGDQVYQADEDEIKPDLSPFAPYQRPHDRTYNKIQKLIKSKLRPHAKKECLKSRHPNQKSCQLKKCFTGLYNYIYPEHSLWKKISISERRKKVHELSQLMYKHLLFKSKRSPIRNMCQARHEPERLHPELSPAIAECVIAQEVELSFEPNAINYTACMPECPGGKQCSSAHGLGQQTLNTFISLRKAGLLPLTHERYQSMKDTKIFEMMNDDLALQFEVLFLHLNYLLKFHDCRDSKLKGEKLIMHAVETYDQDEKSRYLKNFRACYRCMKKYKPGMNLKECYR